jgi:GNAT superfamily N-acetyltransferase
MERTVAGLDALDAICRTITLAFATDPIWSVALATPDGGTDHHQPYWRIFVEGAMRFGTVHRTEHGEAVSVWLPPGAAQPTPELTPELEGDLERLLVQTLDPAGVAAIHGLYARFEASRASIPPGHAYLSLLATHPEHRGQGLGQALLAADLTGWDAVGVPAYLESTNPANDHRYARAGFARIGGFEAVLDGAPVTAMWRPAGPTDTR